MVRHATSDQVGEDPTAGADEARAYRDFWTDVGSTFPDLYGARSTAQYLEDEQWLFQTHLAPLEGLRILKTDLVTVPEAPLACRGQSLCAAADRRRHHERSLP